MGHTDGRRQANWRSLYGMRVCIHTCVRAWIDWVGWIRSAQAVCHSILWPSARIKRCTLMWRCIRTVIFLLRRHCPTTVRAVLQVEVEVSLAGRRAFSPTSPVETSRVSGGAPVQTAAAPFTTSASHCAKIMRSDHRGGRPCRSFTIRWRMSNSAHVSVHNTTTATKTELAVTAKARIHHALFLPTTHPNPSSFLV